MAEAASPNSRLDKLARLKSLKSGLKASRDASHESDESDALDIAMSSAPEPVKGAAKAEPKEAAKADSDAETLSAYFEALGIVPDGDIAKGDASAAKEASGEDDGSVEQDAPAASTPGRDVDVRDLWADPVRDDPMFRENFEPSGNAAVASAPTGEEDDESLDSIIGSFDIDEDEESAAPETEDADVAVAVEKASVEETPDEMPEVDDFDVPVDIEAFEAEIAMSADGDDSADEDVKTPVDVPEVSSADQPLTITFDESRATLLAHVSKQMNCSIDDVVVTAIDWYLDALFGEDDPALTSEAGE